MLKEILIAQAKRKVKDAFLFTKPKVKVHVSQGVVKGYLDNLPNKRKYMSFLGIPYAAKPIGNLRFKSPQKLLKFDHPEIDCTREGDACVHRSSLKRDFIGSENCLHLNGSILL